MTIVIGILDVAAGRCLCAPCARLDDRYPRDGWQLRLPLEGGPGDRPGSAPLSDLDMPTVPPVGLRVPKGRPVETRALAAATAGVRT